MNKVEISDDENLISITWSCSGKTGYYRFVEKEAHVMKRTGCSLCAFHNAGGNTCGLFPAPRCSFGCRKDGKDGQFTTITFEEYIKGLRKIRMSGNDKDFDYELAQSILG